MTADERIESLLNCFGQTIADLPKPKNIGNGFFTAGYNNESRHVAANSVLQCVVPGALDIDQQDKGSMLMALEDYICHLADVIDRMETALSTAQRVTTCKSCQHHKALLAKDWDNVPCSECNSSQCRLCYQISDEYLSDKN